MIYRMDWIANRKEKNELRRRNFTIEIEKHKEQKVKINNEIYFKA